MRVYLDCLGCRLNQAELERMAAQLRAAGCELVPSAEDCEQVVLNTCTVTHRAARDSRARVRQLHRANPSARIAVTGCWSTLEAQAAAALPGVQLVVPNAEKDQLAALLCQDQGRPRARLPIPGSRRRARAFLQIQDGCDQACAYCLTTQARGPSRSTPLRTIVAELRAAEAGGALEAVLCGVQLSDWGRVLPGSPNLSSLLDTLLASSAIPRLRLSSLEPWGLPTDLFQRWTDARLCRQLHLPLQSGCDATLARMARPYRRAQASELIRQARAWIPELALSTDILVGFPGETEAEFTQTLAWLAQLNLADAHVFTFSPRPGTRAASMPDPVPSAVARERRLAVMEQVERSRRRYRQRLIGTTQAVLWVSARADDGGTWQLGGLTDHGVPVRATAGADLWNQLSPVRLLRQEPWGLTA